MQYTYLIFYDSLLTKDKDFADQYDLYELSTISETTHLSKAGLLLFALLCGGNYDVPGIEGYGLVHALALAQCSFGNQLIHAMETLSGQNLATFLDQWQDDMDYKLETNTSGRLQHTSPTLAQKIPNTFPQLEILYLYLRLLTSWSSNPSAPPDSSLWHFTRPSVLQITQFCQLVLHWTTELKLHTEFKKLLWEGFCLQMIYSVCTQ